MQLAGHAYAWPAWLINALSLISFRDYRDGLVAVSDEVPVDAANRVVVVD